MNRYVTNMTNFAMQKFYMITIKYSVEIEKLMGVPFHADWNNAN